MSQKGKPDNNDNDVYFNAFRKVGKYYDKYSARKRDKSSIPAATHKSKVENKPKEKEIGNKRPRSNTSLQEKKTEKLKTKRYWPFIYAVL